MATVRGLVSGLRSRIALIGRLPELQSQLEFCDFELRRLNEQLRTLHAADALLEVDREQTKGSFDFQWREVPEGEAMPSSSEFMEGVQEEICRMTGLSPEWFAGKKVVDIGCGVGRYTYGLLQLGARVTACDQSCWALQRTEELCAAYRDRLETRTIDLLTWDEPAEYDLAFCFGVAHHTGNTYLAIRNVAAKAGHVGHIFLMVYGWPIDPGDFEELNTYEQLRRELRLMSPTERLECLTKRYGKDKANGYFDAISPRINDLLTFEEVADLLSTLGFEDVRRTVSNRNIHVSARRRDE